MACGARSELDEWNADRGGGGEGGAVGGGGSGGEAGAPSCDDLLTNAAHVRLPDGGSVVRDVAIVEPTKSSDHLCFVSELAEPNGSPGIARACFEAWTTWPGSIGMAHVSSGNTGDLAVSQGLVTGYALLAGDLDDDAAPGARIAWDVVSDEITPVWYPLDVFARHRAVMMTRSPSGKLAAGLAYQVAGSEYLRLVRLAPGGIEAFGPLSCAAGTVAGDVVTLGERVVAITRSGSAPSRCDAGLQAPHRVQVYSLAEGDAIELLYEAAHAVPVGDVRIARAREDAVWIAWQAGSSVSIARLGPAGPEVSPRLVTDESVRSIALATMNGKALVATVARTAPQAPARIVVQAVDESGEVLPFGSFDTENAPWIDDLEIAVSPYGGSVLVAYVGQLGSSVRAFARRFDCTR